MRKFVGTSEATTEKTLGLPQVKGFVRVLDPVDPWLDPKEYTDEQRQENFRGRTDWDISEAMEARCPPPRVLAALHGQRRDPMLDRPAYYRFQRKEVQKVGGDLEDTPSDPPWPDDYCHAHHDVVRAHDEVAAHMAALHADNPERVSAEREVDILILIAELLEDSGVHRRFKKNATYRFKRMFLDGGAERELWIRIAKVHPFLLEQDTVSKELRRMYQDRGEGRREWVELMDAVGLPDTERKKFR